eukprot:scaffold1659_cov255-Pinguiococcus_pyrenoidosus.AAC.22
MPGGLANSWSPHWPQAGCSWAPWQPYRGKLDNREPPHWMSQPVFCFAGCPSPFGVPSESIGIGLWRRPRRMVRQALALETGTPLDGSKSTQLGRDQEQLPGPRRCSSSLVIARHRSSSLVIARHRSSSLVRAAPRPSHPTPRHRMPDRASVSTSRLAH